MNTHHQATDNSNRQPALTDRLRHSKALIPTLAVMGVTVAALAAALVVNQSGAQPGGAQASANAVQQQGKKIATAPATVVRRAPAQVTQAPRAAICTSCGTVESVLAVQRQGQVNGVAVGGATVGIGTVAGGVVGGLLGNQVGRGSGKTAMTVLGAAGGALAGNAIEKNMKKVTVYQMRVRMHDGSLQTIEQASAVPSGSRVIVEGNTLRLAPAAHSAANSPLFYSAHVA
jgi:outer membrane lipoprotein SlyB